MLKCEVDDKGNVHDFTATGDPFDIAIHIAQIIDGVHTVMLRTDPEDARQFRFAMCELVNSDRPVWSASGTIHSGTVSTIYVKEEE